MALGSGGVHINNPRGRCENGGFGEKYFKGDVFRQKDIQKHTDLIFFQIKITLLMYTKLNSDQLCTRQYYNTYAYVHGQNGVFNVIPMVKISYSEITDSVKLAGPAYNLYSIHDSAAK